MKSQRVLLPPSSRVPVVCMVMIALVVMALGVGHVAHRQQVIQLGYELGQAMTELNELEEDNRRLRLEKSVLTNPARIERLARSLGMAPPTSAQVRIAPQSAKLAAAGGGS